MVVKDFYFVCALIRPSKTEAVLLVDADTILAPPITGEGFKSVSGRTFEVIEVG